MILCVVCSTVTPHFYPSLDMVCMHHFYRFYKAAKALAENKLSDGTGRKPLYRYTCFMEVLNWLRSIANVLHVVEKHSMF